MYSNVIHWTIAFSFQEHIVQLFCLYWAHFPFFHLIANTLFKLEIGLAFVGDIEEESIGALITTIHYPNKHGTQPLLDTNSRDVKCLVRDKDLESLLH